MQEPIALDEQEEETILATPTSKPLHVRFARHVSNILSPQAISIPFILLVALYHAPSRLTALAYTLVVLFFLSVGPMAYILIGVRTGKFTDVDVSVRSQRSGPFMFAIISTLFGLFVLTFINGPKNLETIMLTTIVSGILLMITTLWWKISIHASSLAGVATMLTALYGKIFLPAFLLLALVCWSRVVLRRHTLAQVIAGSLAGILLISITLTIRGV